MPVVIEKRKQTRYNIGPANVYPYPAHMHDAAEIVIMRRGYLNITVNGTAYVLEPNSILAVFPGMIHSYESASEEARGVFVGFVPGVIDEYQTVFSAMWPASPLIRIEAGDEELENVVERLEQYVNGKGKQQLLLPYIHLLAACLLMKLDLVSRNELHGNSFMYEVTDYIQAHFAENLSLESVAKALGVGKSHLSHLFSQQLKINFRRYLNTIRVENACIMLQENESSIKEVCFDCGFDSLRTFHRVFLEEQRMTPGEFRERMKKGILTLDGEGKKE